MTLDRYSHLVDRDEEANLRVLAEAEADHMRTRQGSTAAATAWKTTETLQP